MRPLLIANHTNRVVGATLTASGARASTALRLRSESRQGGGEIALTGPYTGALDRLVEVAVTAGTGTALRPSRPLLAGVGSGTLAVTSVDVGAVPEQISLRLVATGSAATAAELPFFGATLRARVAGIAGNDLALTVQRRLVLAETQWSLLAELAAGTATLEGAQYDWGSVPSGDAQVPADAPRRAFEGQPGVYRHWRSWDSGRWVYHLDPAPSAAVAAGTRVLAVSGDYLLTLTDGTTTETYAAVTVYQALTQLAARSALVEVVGTVAADRAPGGMAVTDVPLRTDAYALPVVATIASPYGARRLDGLTVAAAAPTETWTVVRLASGRWAVRGDLSGVQPEARTGVAYANALLGFTIPAATIPDGAQAGIVAEPKFVSRQQGETLPAVCGNPRLGAAAVPKSVTFVYTIRPPAPCSCAALAVPYVSEACLGFGGENMELPPAVASRVALVYTWREQFIRANTRWVDAQPSTVTGGSPGQPGQYRVRCAATVSFGSGYSGTQVAYLLDTFNSLALAQARAEAISGTTTERSSQAQNIGGYGIWYSTNGGWPGPYNSNPVWSASVETLVEAVEGQEGTPTEAVPAHWEGAGTEFGALDEVLTMLLGTLGVIYESAAALALWDALLVEAEGELDAHLRATAGDDIGLPLGYWSRRYAAACDNIKIVAGIYPSFEVADSAAGRCWHDDPEASAWWVDASGEYLPAFTGRGYASCKRINGEVQPTFEFGLGIMVACEGSLKEGDSITVRISGATADGYQVGDRYQVPVVAAAPAYWRGGAPGNQAHTWTVRGSASGAQADWTWDPADPHDYAGLLGLRMAAGGIPFAVGDTWAITLEGGTYQWRRDGGAWQAGDLYGAAPDLGDGLSLAITGGAAPSFVAGDTWSFEAIAAAGAAQCITPREGRAWAWDGDAATLGLDLGAVYPVGAVLLALHTLPAGAVLEVWGGPDSDADAWMLAPTWSAGPIVALTAPGTSARYLRLSISGCGSAGAALGWLWAGVPWAPTVSPSAMTRVISYGLARTQGRNPSGVYRGRGTGGQWSWSLDAGGALLPADVAGLIALLDHVAAAGLEWVGLVPDRDHPEGATLAQIDADAVTLTEHLGYALGGEALVSVDLPFRAVLA